MKPKVLALALLLGLAFAQTDPLALGRSYTALFYEGRLEELFARFSPEVREALKGLEGLRAFRGQVVEQLGSETAVQGERVESARGLAVYVRTATFQKYAGPIIVQWTLDPAGTVAGFFVRPAPVAARSRFLEYQTKTVLRLPFEGEWFVFWGGRTVEENYHVVAPDQRFAYDLLVVREGKSHEGDGTRNEQYFCFGRPILAPAAGVVVVAVDGVPDNKPGEMNPRQAAGNYTVLDHENGEFSLLAHFERGSLRVRVGDRVAAGDLLGRCGNSGNSSEAHLHYHLQNAPEFGRGEGLPAQFLDYLADGRPVGRGEPARGQTIRPR